jgi:hypothetical protein
MRGISSNGPFLSWNGPKMAKKQDFLHPKKAKNHIIFFKKYLNTMD